MYVEGKTYHEIAASLSRHVKSIDNALQRIKRKVELHLRGRSEEGGGDRELVSVGQEEPVASVSGNRTESAANGRR
jgi:DNA-binding NarL/FixJ family response regulator